MESKPTTGSMRAARQLRIKIHSMRRGKEPSEADHPANKRWLDDVTPADAQIIDEETALPELIEAGKAIVDLVEAWMNGPRFEGVVWKSEEDHPPGLRAMRAALAKVKGER